MGRTISVLHVDDDEEFGDLTATYLERVGEHISVDHVESAGAALEYLETETVDCILSDYDMPGRDGLDLLSAVRADYPDLPFILFTGKGTEEVAEQALANEATDYVQKESGEPVFKLLAHRIRNAVHARIATGSFVRGGSAVAVGGAAGDPQPVADGNGESTGDGEDAARAALDAAPDGLVVVDETGTIREANRRAREMVSPEGEQLAGRALQGLVEEGTIEPKVLEGYEEAVEALADGDVETVDVEFQGTRDGPKRIYEARFATRPDDSGVVATIREVTEQREREDELQRYETLLRTMPDTVIMTDVEGNLLEVHGFEGWSGFTLEELEGANFTEVTPEEYAEKAEEVALELFEDDERMEATYEMEIETKDGEHVPFENHLRLLPPDDDGMVPGTMSVLRNIEDRKERERQLNALNESVRELITADSPEEIAEMVADTALEVLGFELATVAFHDEDEGRLEPVASSGEDGELLGDPLSSGACPAWEAFQAGEVQAYEDVGAHEDVDEGDTPIRSEVICPLGKYGVLLLGSSDPGDFDDRAVSLAEMLAGNAESALERAFYLEEVEARERELEVYETAVEVTSDGIAVMDEDGEYKLVNREYAEAFGMDREEFLNSAAEDVGLEAYTEEMPDDYEDRWIEAYFGAVETGQSQFRFDTRLTLPDGPAVMDNRVTAILRDDDTVDFVVVSRDITEQRERQEQLERLHESTRELMASESKDDVASEVVAAVDATLGFPASVVRLVDDAGEYLEPAAVTDRARDLAGDRSAVPTEGNWLGEAFQSGEVVHNDDAREMVDDWEVRSLVSVPIGEYGTLGIVDDEVGAYDDSDVQIAEILASNAESTFDRVEKEEALRARERELSRQIDRLDQFANVVSHDLRNPLNVAKGHLSFVRERIDDPEHVETVEDALDRMEAIIQDVLTLAREGDEATDLVPVDLAETAEACWSNVDTRQATLEVDTDRRALADESRLRQLFENLVRNGIDHVGDDVTIRVGGLDGGFYVEDDGPGIPEEDREQVFETGFSTSSEGTGFGLNIVRTIAEAHDWEVALTDGSDGGARFEFTGVEFVDG